MIILYLLTLFKNKLYYQALCVHYEDGNASSYLLHTYFPPLHTFIKAVSDEKNHLSCRDMQAEIYDPIKDTKVISIFLHPHLFLTNYECMYLCSYVQLLFLF